MNGKLDKTFETIRCELGFRHKLQQSIVTSLRDKSWWKILYCYLNQINLIALFTLYEENILPLMRVENHCDILNVGYTLYNLTNLKYL